MRSLNRKAVLTAACLGLVAPSVFAVDFPETEPNDTRATANVRTLAPGDSVSGITTGVSTTVAGAGSADYFDVSTSAAPSTGIWRYRLVLTQTGTAGHTATLRGRTQTNGTINTTENVFQTALGTTTPARFTQWYASAAASRVLYRVVGAAATTGTYTSTLERDPVTPTVIPGSFTAGNISISTVGQTGATQTDTEIFIYDSSFNFITGAQNDEVPTPGTGAGSTLNRTLPAGTYIIAVSNFNTANNAASPSDERDPNYTVMEFPNALANSSPTTAVDVSFTLTDNNGTTTQAATKTGVFDVVFFQVTLAPTPLPLLTACNASPSTTVPAGSSVTLSTNVAWTGAPGTVTANLSNFGLSAAEPLTNNGGGNYSIVLSVPPSQPLASEVVTLSATNGAGTGTCNINLNIALGNDTCASATTIPNTTFPVSVNGDNTDATSAGDRTSTCTDVINSVWYDFTAPAAGGAFLFDTEGSAQFDTVITVYSSCTGAELGCDDEGGSGSLSSLTLNLTPNQNIKIMVSTWFADDPGAFVLNVTETTPPPPPPANDQCSGAELIPNTTLPITVLGDSTFATNINDPAPSCLPTTVRGIWYEFTAPTAGTYIFDTEGSVVADLIVTAYASCGGAEIGCDDEGAVTVGQARLALALTNGQNIRIQIAADNLLFVPNGPITLNVSRECVTFTASPVAASTCIGGTATFTSTVAVGGAPTFQWETAPSSAGPFTALVDGPVAGLGTVSGATTTTLTIAAADLAASTTRFRLTATEAGCGSNSSADVALTVLDCPPNDTCAGAVAATIGTTVGDNANASSAGDPIPSCQTSSNKGVWFTFTAGPTGGTYQIDTENSAQVDTVLTVFASCGGAQLACDDDGGTAPANSSSLSISLTANQVVQIQVSSFGVAPAGGGFNLNITECTSISSQPTNVTASIGGTANFSVVAGPGATTFQWQRNPLGAGTFADLTDGVVAGLGTVSGATTADLTISNAEAAASTDTFRVVVTGICAPVNSTAAVLTVGNPFPARCNGADIAYDNGDFLPRAEIVDGTNGTPAIPGPFGGTNNGVTEADYNVFFANFFDAFSVADIANDDGTTRVPTPAPGTVVNNGVTEGDYNYFFSVFFDGCSL